MRAIMISMVILFFCLSMKMVNTVDSDYFTERNQTLLGWSGTPMIDEDDFPSASPDNYKDNIKDLTTPSEIISASLGDALWTTATFIIKSVKFLVDLTYATFNFGTFLQNLGHDCEGVSGCTEVKLYPDYAATLLNLGATICNLITIAQIISGRSYRDGI